MPVTRNWRCCYGRRTARRPRGRDRQAPRSARGRGQIATPLQVDLTPALDNSEVAHVIHNVVLSVGIQIDALTDEPPATLLSRVQPELVRLRAVHGQGQQFAPQARYFGTREHGLRELPSPNA